MNDRTLPSILPVFPLTGAILLPGGHLPLNIFEPRYKEMVEFARDRNGIIGMIQPRGGMVSTSRENNDLFGTAERGREIYDIGCAGIIREFKVTEEKQYFIILEGIKRFRIINELPMIHSFREVESCFDSYEKDGTAAETIGDELRDRFLETLTNYVKYMNMKIDLDVLSQINDEEFVNLIAMVCPFDASEKQMLIEVPTINDRANLMIKIIDFNMMKHNVSSDNHIH